MKRDARSVGRSVMDPPTGEPAGGLGGPLLSGRLAGWRLKHLAPLAFCLVLQPKANSSSNSSGNEDSHKGEGNKERRSSKNVSAPTVNRRRRVTLLSGSFEVWRPTVEIMGALIGVPAPGRRRRHRRMQSRRSGVLCECVNWANQVSAEIRKPPETDRQTDTSRRLSVGGSPRKLLKTRAEERREQSALSRRLSSGGSP